MKVQLFARLRELAGRSECECDVPAGATVEDVWRVLSERHSSLQPFGPRNLVRAQRGLRSDERSGEGRRRGGIPAACVRRRLLRPLPLAFGLWPMAFSLGPRA